MTLLVTGITGHSGKFFLHELINNKYEGKVRCIVRSNSDTSLIDSSGLNIEKIVADLDDQEFMNKAMLGVDTVLHIGSIFYSVKVMNAAVKCNVRRAILVHTTGIYSKYKSASEEYKNIELSIAKIIDESHSPIGLIYLRPTMIFGYVNDRNMIVFIKMTDKLRLLPIIDQGKSLLQPVNGRDLGKGYYQLLSTPEIMHGDYILSGERPITMREMFMLISEKLKKNTTFLSIPLSLGEFMARALNICTLGKINYIEKVQRMGEDRSFPHETARLDFGYQPMPFADGLEIEVREYEKLFKQDKIHS